MKMSENDILSVENLCVHFPSGAKGEPLCAVHDLSFTVGAGEIVGIVGESGSGKSVTYRPVCLSGGRAAAIGRAAGFIFGGGGEP